MTGVALEPPYRPARAEDAAVLARLMNAAGHGLPLALWTGIAAKEGGDPWAVGAARMAARAGKPGLVVVDHGAGAVAMLMGYPIRAEEEIGPDMPPHLRPLQEMENLAVGSWYVNAVAVLPGHRGGGVGLGLMRVAERIAEAEGLSALSLIVADDNEGARRLYTRLGFSEAARRPMVAGGGWSADGGAEWILMIRRLD